ncbi:Vomeronasal type-2 receptor 116, partial [Microtus ochrogaster]
KNYQYLLTLYFAIEEINKDAHLLPNVTLGFHLYNAFDYHYRTLEGPLMWLSGRSEFIPNYKCKTQHKALAIIAGVRPEFSAAIGTLLELYKIPQVSYGNFDSALTDKDTFPSLYQTSPKDTALIQGVISLLLHFSWKWVGLIVSDDVKDQQECIPCSIQEYPNPERNSCLPKSVKFLSFDDSLGMALACTALCLFVSTVVVIGIFLKHQDSPIVKANNRTLSFILLISLLLCFLCPFLFIGQPNTASCIMQQITFALVFTLALSTVLTKTITVILAFRATAPGKTMRRLFVSGFYNSVIPICVLIQLILLAIWLGISPPYIEVDAYSEHGHIIILCNKGSVTAFYCVLAYLGILALVSFSVAFLARNLPDTFNEAKFLTFSMLVFCSVWVTFLPVYHSTKDRTMVAVEVFSILVSTAGLLGCIFFPKCYIILLRSDKNSLKSFKNKTQSRKN